MPKPYSQAIQDFVIQSDRKTLPSPGQDGAAWNQWLVETKIAPLYALLLEVITIQFSVCDEYLYWPTLPLPGWEIDAIGSMVSNAFWKLVPGCDRRLFLASTEATTDIGVTAQGARFDLRERASDSEDQLHRLFRKLDLGGWKAVAPRGAALDGLKRLATDGNNGINVISPEIVLGLFKSKRNSNILCEIWETEYQFAMEYINGILRYVTQKATAETLNGCWILPMMNNTLEQLQIEGHHYTEFFVPPEDPALAEAVVSLTLRHCVHQGIDEGVLDCLMSEKLPRLSLFRVSTRQLPKILKLVGTKSPAQKYRIATAIWQWYNKSADHEKLGILRTLPIVAIFKASDDSASVYDFITLADYTAGHFPALIQRPLSGNTPGVVSWNIEALNEMLSCFANLSLVCRDTFPSDLANKEYLSHPQGLCRFLRCIEKLAEKSYSTIEPFIQNTFQNKPKQMDVSEH